MIETQVIRFTAKGDTHGVKLDPPETSEKRPPLLIVHLLNESNYTITFAEPGVSHVEEGASIAPQSGLQLYWDEDDQVWRKVI